MNNNKFSKEFEKKRLAKGIPSDKIICPHCGQTNYKYVDIDLLSNYCQRCGKKIRE